MTDKMTMKKAKAIFVEWKHKKSLIPFNAWVELKVKVARAEGYLQGRKEAKRGNK